MSNPWFHISVVDDGGRFRVRITPNSYGATDLLTTEADKLTAEIAAATTEARRLNAPPKQFYR